MNSVCLFFIGLGILFNFFGCLGLLRLPDIYNRLQAATKCVTLGTCCILAGVLFHYGFTSAGMKALLAIPLIFFAATTAAHALIKGAYHFGTKMWDKSVIDHYKDEAK